MIVDAYFNSQNIDKIYIGTVLVWERTATP